MLYVLIQLGMKWQWPESGAVDLLATAVHGRRDDHVRHRRVDEVKAVLRSCFRPLRQLFSSILELQTAILHLFLTFSILFSSISELPGAPLLIAEGDPILLRHILLAIAQAIAHHRRLRLYDPRDVHLRHGVREAFGVPSAGAHVTTVGRLGVEGQHLAALGGHQLRVLRARHEVPDERLVGWDPGLGPAELLPGSARGCAEAREGGEPRPDSDIRPRRPRCHWFRMLLELKSQENRRETWKKLGKQRRLGRFGRASPFAGG